MSSVKFDSQKIEQLLNAATSERQRKMYQALLDKARNQERSSKSEKTVEIIPSTEKKSQTKTKGQTKTQKKTKTVKKNQKASSESTTIEVFTPTKKSSKTVTESKLIEDSLEVPSQTEVKSQSKKSEKQESAVKSPLFQAIGSVIATPYLKGNRLKIVINDSEYDLLSAQGFRHHVHKRLKEELEKNGSRKMFFRLYPKFKYNYKSQESKLSFSLVCFNQDCEKINEESIGFVVRGIWQYIAHSKSPVISIYRNHEQMELFKKLNESQQSNFVRPHHIPVVWDTTIEPFKFNPELEKDSQMPRYFVQVRGIFKDDLYMVEETLQEPTLKIPKHIKLPTPRLDKLGEPQRPSRSKKNKSQSEKKADEKSNSSAAVTL